LKIRGLFLAPQWCKHRMPVCYIYLINIADSVFFWGGEVEPVTLPLEYGPVQPALLIF